MKDWAELIRAFASLLWPIFAFALLWMFQEQIREILARLRRGKVFGQEIELEESLKKLDESAQAAASETPQIPQVSAETGKLEMKHSETNDVARRVLDEASRSPKVALMLLASELEREVRQLLASMGLLKKVRPPSLLGSLQAFEELGVLPRHLAESLGDFWNLRSRLVHGYTASSDDVVRAIDSGLTILRSVRAIPHEINAVYHPGVEVYADPEGKKLREGIKAVILETISPGGAARTLRAFPTTKTHFQKGKHVAWEWNRDLVVGESWYRHPDTGEIVPGWRSSMEFVGRHLEDV